MKKDDRARYNAMKHDLQVGQLQSQEFLAEAPTALPDIDPDTMAPLAPGPVGRFAGMRIALLTGGASLADLDEVAAKLQAEGALVEKLTDPRPEAHDALLSPAFARAIADLLDDATIV